jgi:hypothetical protein
MDILQFINGLAWPALFLIAGIYYRKEISAAFNRIKELGPGGIKLDGAPATQSVVPPANQARDIIADIKQFVSADQLDPGVAQLRSELEKRAGQDKDQKIEILLHALASTNVQLVHERNYNQIFGSQIVALNQMNQIGGSDEQALKDIYNNAVARWPESYKHFTFEDWKAFLLKSGLVFLERIAMN